MVTVRSKLRHITTTTSLCICKCISILFYFIPRHSLTGYLLHFLISDWTPYSTLRNARPLRFKDLTRPRLTAKVQSLNDGIEASLLKLICDHIDQTTNYIKKTRPNCGIYIKWYLPRECCSVLPPYITKTAE